MIICVWCAHVYMCMCMWGWGGSGTVPRASDHAASPVFGVPALRARVIGPARAHPGHTAKNPHNPK